MRKQIVDFLKYIFYGKITHRKTLIIFHKDFMETKKDIDFHKRCPCYMFSYDNLKTYILTYNILRKKVWKEVSYKPHLSLNEYYDVNGNGFDFIMKTK